MTETVVGIDLGIRKIAYAIAQDGKIYSTGAYEAPIGHRAWELLHLARYLRAVMDQLVEATNDILVMIEEPLIGNNRKYSMAIAQNYGSTLTTLGDYMGLANLNVLGVNVSTWKKQIVGSGRADKEMVKNHINVVSERYSELCGHDQDRYDAACVCLYGCLISTRAEELTRS